ncbi:hypothetical protein XELAEV_18035460mg [Xenopus laevis]|uniref:Uncharacterized protein n=1 Tax=Xenopus laevis TaxID=8355 RepID=A0A974CH25_XENLA|nr:hypothetical protein XELAEV_18035460mg [Xenopus laevis]
MHYGPDTAAHQTLHVSPVPANEYSQMYTSLLMSSRDNFCIRQLRVSHQLNNLMPIFLYRVERYSKII